ncbi:hypothetical protein Tco_0790200 [Tanacetum coccineum]
MKARTLISHGCQGFLASVMDTSLESPNIENLSVVREFADVFPDELPGLPPAREIEFGIELIPGAEPISKAPYRMAPALREKIITKLIVLHFTIHPGSTKKYRDLRTVLWGRHEKQDCNVSRLIEGPELIEITNEKVAVAKEKLKEARSRQKSYADKHRRYLEFQVGDRVFF